jgi:hypothetical protein
MKTAPWPHHDGTVHSSTLEPRAARRAPCRSLQEEFSVSSEIIDCFLLRGEALDVFGLKLDDELFHITRDEFNRWKNGTMSVRSEWTIDHCGNFDQLTCQTEVMSVVTGLLTEIIWEAGNSSAEVR